ncbi:MmpS family transport accessory protein [Mycobacterium yunnanensis]|uniref:MmpS family transport accessory protein n=1 Tax=Mycobacterium yunnanensis TaxID=368477 RepID=UPI0035583EB2
MAYEVDGTDGAAGTASYIDATGVSRAVDMRVPWTFVMASPELSFSSGVTASADGSALACRVVIDGAVRLQQQGPSVVDCQVPVS